MKKKLKIAPIQDPDNFHPPSHQTIREKIQTQLVFDGSVDAILEALRTEIRGIGFPNGGKWGTKDMRLGYQKALSDILKRLK